jgi:hypothetical protein
MITTVSMLPPAILQSFLQDLLLTCIERNKLYVEKKIARLQRRKIRPQDTGKKKEFQRLIKEYYKVYERKKAKEEKYKAKIKDSTKMPSIPNS